MINRYKLTLEYKGTPFYGWQRQADMPSIQQHLEEAVFKFCGETVNAYVAGRTDAGVHAKGQVCHIDLSKYHDPFRVQEALNHYLRNVPIRIIDVAKTDTDFHARFSATFRRYEYVIFNRRTAPALNTEFVWHVPKPLDANAMHDAAQIFVGTHDFSSFRAAECQAKSPIKSLEYFNLNRDGDYITADIKAKSFLHHQVRNMMGSLSMVGKDKWTKAQLQEVLAIKDRRAAALTAPASGLFLVEVGYFTHAH